MRRELAFVLESSFPGMRVAASHWTALSRLCELRQLARRSVLLHQGDRVSSLFGVVSGEIASQFGTLDGDVSVLEHVGAGQLFGLAAFATGMPSTYDAVAVRSTKLLVLGPKAYAYLMDEVPGFARGLLRELALRHAAALQQLEASRHRSAIERLSLAIAQLTPRRAERTSARGSVFIRTTQAELAALANLSRQTANELIAELARQRRVKPVYGGLWIRR